VKIGILGGGPVGLYFALLMKKQSPTHDIRIVEQNPAGATYGWGVVFSDRALSYLEASDPDSYHQIEQRLQAWDDQAIVLKGQKIRIDGLGFSGISRIELLRILQERCRRLGVELQFDTRLTNLSHLQNCDLIVGADGVNSVVREAYQAQFQPSVQALSNKYVWYGTNQLFDCLTLTFRENRDGAFVAHHYRHSDTASTFIVECDADTWAAAGLAAMSEDESRRYCDGIFKDDLGGQALLMNKSRWLSFQVVTNQRWSYENIVLIGDALRTVHFPIGSGTRTALEDAIALAHALAQNQDPREALWEFERARRPMVESPRRRGIS
jgi:2-polyprenyl-6-methoxyphenol hydroxylase-like FAD-dependent oxidoreductase